MGDISDNERLSVLEDCVRFSEGVELDDAAIGISSTGAMDGFYLHGQTCRQDPLGGLLEAEEPNLPSLLPGDWADHVMGRDDKRRSHRVWIDWRSMRILLHHGRTLDVHWLNSGVISPATSDRGEEISIGYQSL